jgi:hypothetical protein
MVQNFLEFNQILKLFLYNFNFINFLIKSSINYLKKSSINFLFIHLKLLLHFTIIFPSPQYFKINLKNC